MTLRRDAPEGFRSDEVYHKLVRLADGMTDRDARQAMAALVLLLVNHIADERVLDEALEIVRDLPPAGPSRQTIRDGERPA